MKREKWNVTAFYDSAIKYIDKPVDEEDIVVNDYTEMFFAELSEQLREGRILTINIGGNRREGKSTVGFFLLFWIHKELKKIGKIPKYEKVGLYNVARDQQEFSEKIVDPRLTHNVILTDEWNELENTGENVTVERALQKNFSDIQAVRYIHRVSCSPKDLVDENTDIILEVIPTVRDKSFITKLRLYYRFLLGGDVRTQLIGHININVGEVIKNWEKKIRPIMEKRPEMITEEEKKIIDDNIMIDPFVEYNVRKMQKINLLTKEGIFRPRELKYSALIYDIIQRLRPMASYGKITKDTIRNHVERAFKEQKIPFSFLGIHFAIERVYGLLSGIKDLESQRANFGYMMKKGLKDGDIRARQQSIEETEKSLQYLIVELNKEKELYAKYNEIIN